MVQGLIGHRSVIPEIGQSLPGRQERFAGSVYRTKGFSIEWLLFMSTDPFYGSGVAVVDLFNISSFNTLLLYIYPIQWVMEPRGLRYTTGDVNGYNGSHREYL